MYGLLMRLSALDADAASAVRVIGFFDSLVEQGAAIDVILRQTAALAECPVGVRSADRQLSARTEPAGVVHDGQPPEGSRMYRLTSGDEVWLERHGPEHPLDELLIERFALAASVALSPGHRQAAETDRGALLRLAISATAPAGERRKAADRLGIRQSGAVHVLAMAGPAAGLEEICRDLPGQCRAHAGAVEVVLASQPLPEIARIPPGCRVGASGPHQAADLPEAWREACTALRFTLPSERSGPSCPPLDAAMVRFGDLGGFAAIAEALTPEQISRIPDVAALDTLAGLAGGKEMLRTLEAVAATESLRRAAGMLHLHHNSVAHRVARAEQVIGYSVSDPYARPRLMLALVLRRVRASAALF